MEKRLQTILSHAGVASRRHAGKIIEEGKVKVNGNLVTEKGFRVDPEKDKVTVSGKPVGGAEKKHYFLFNKPEGVISTAIDTHDRKKVVDFFKKVDARLYPVGRLDKDTTGLMIITNDGSFAQKLSHPSFEVEKEYTVTVKGRLTEKNMRKMMGGIRVEGEITSPCKVKRLESPPGGDSSYRVILHEGRKRQIRKMFKAVGFNVESLERTKYAGLTLDGLKRGAARPLTEKEVDKLKSLGKPGKKK
ncbi:pseudouridine synthase [Candidatus Omnitrophota bacterium]